MPDVHGAETEVIAGVLAEVSDVDFIAWLALHRPTYGYEAWRADGPRAAKMAVRQLNEYLLMGAPTAATVLPALDKLVPMDEATLVRAYRLCLERAPSAAERERWLAEPFARAADLCRELLESFESYQVDGLAEQADAAAFGARREVHHHTRTHDAFISHMTRKREAADMVGGKLERLAGRRLRVVSAIGPDDEADRNFVAARLAMLGIEADLVRTDAAAVADGSALVDCDVFLTVNQLLYDRQAEQLAAIRAASALSICWHMDNHHEFGFAAAITRTFDIIMPAHPADHAALHGGCAVVGTVVPCGSNQWTAALAASLFAEQAGLERSDRLYGRFNSYAGRNALRDEFVRAAADRLGADLAVVAPGANNWFARTPAERFRELSSRKVVLCASIYNDTSLRLLDALLAGALPIVPYGLPGLGLLLDLDDSTVPVIQYQPENVRSLERAVRAGCERFDREGADGIVARHTLAFDRHLLRNRIDRILREVLGNTAHL